MKTPLLVGLTGGIGAGKSTVARIFAKLGVPVYYADDRAKWLTANNPEIRSRVKEHFGTAAFSEDGSLNRAALSQEIFADAEKARLLESWVHPAVRQDFKAWVAEQKTPYMLKEAALLFESGSYQELDKLIVVTSPEALRIRRVLARDTHRDRKQVAAIMARQIPEQVKAANADFVIANDQEHLLIPQVLRVHKQLKREVY